MVLSAASLETDLEGLAFATHVLRPGRLSHAAALLRACVGFSLSMVVVIGVMVALAGT